MDTSNLPSNSNKTKKVEAAPAKKVEKVISGDVVVRKKTISMRLRERFLSGESAREVVTHVIEDVIIPDVNNMIVDAGITALERRFLGGERSTARRRQGSIASSIGNFTTNYGAFSSGPIGNPNVAAVEQRLSRRARTTHNVSEKIIPTRAEADAVLEMMYELLQKFEEVTLSEVLQMLGETPEFTDEQVGWTDLRGARVERARGGGYFLALPGTDRLT